MEITNKDLQNDFHVFYEKHQGPFDGDFIGFYGKHDFEQNAWLQQFYAANGLIILSGMNMQMSNKHYTSIYVAAGDNAIINPNNFKTQNEALEHALKVCEGLLEIQNKIKSKK